MSLQPLVRTEGLRKVFSLKTGILSSILGRKTLLPAVDNINLEVRKGEILGLAGESGCGKTTLGRMLALLETPDEGHIVYQGVDIGHLKKSELKEYRRKIRMIFQDPYTSLNPRFTIRKVVEEPLLIHREDPKKRLDMVSNALERVGLKPAEMFLNRFPNELSGGQRQRVVIARALILNPEFVVADEPVSMLDISIRAGVLNLLLKLREDLNLTYLFISHDLAVIRYMCSRVGIMYLGKIVEIGQVEDVISGPLHPYTQTLLAAAPIPDPTTRRKRTTVGASIPDPGKWPRGCRFHPRCSLAMDICREREPALLQIRGEHFVACHVISKS